MPQVEQQIPEHTDFETAPGLLEGATKYSLSPEECNMQYWFQHVAGGAVKGLVHGRKPDADVPDFLRDPGDPLRENLIAEFAFRSLSEEAATKACAYVTAAAPDIDTMNFYATQTIDEARHSDSFRYHLVDLGIPEEELIETVERVAGADRDRVLGPLWDWGLPVFDGNFINGVIIVTILLEGILAPTTELSERKWKPLSEATAQVERGACVDEIRHLTVGSEIVKRHLQENPGDKSRIEDLIVEGRKVWDELPAAGMIYEREKIFQKGLERHADIAGDYEIFEGKRLVDTTAEDRLAMAVEWSKDVQDSRLTHMGLEGAVPQAA